MKYKAISTTWIVAVLLASYYALAWSYKPGTGRTGSPMAPKNDGLQAVVLVHPNCPCTAASLKLFAEAVERFGSSLSTLVVIPGPEVETTNVEQARKIPRSTIQFAPAKEIFSRFGLSTSGHILIWNNRNLIFSGGVTDARGEEVKAGSFDALVQALKSKRPGKDTLVFGCAAFDREAIK